LNALGITILLVEQNVKHCLSISRQAWVLANGRVALSGTGPELLGDDNVRRAYLGL
jgi:branched-chain amino acid transport system ATP-binding protein